MVFEIYDIIRYGLEPRNISSSFSCNSVKMNGISLLLCPDNTQSQLKHLFAWNPTGNSYIHVSSIAY